MEKKKLKEIKSIISQEEVKKKIKKKVFFSILLIYVNE